MLLYRIAYYSAYLMFVILCVLLIKCNACAIDTCK